MKASVHCGRGLANHNDRSFLRGMKERPEHIKEGIFDRTKDVGGKKAISRLVREGMPLEEAELQYYNLRFAEWLKEQHSRNESSGHPERNKTMEQVYKSSRYAPKEVILQVGNIDESIDGKQLGRICAAWAVDFKEKYPQFEILDYTRHTDEGTPHIHLRGVFVAQNGGINQTQALKEMNIERPDPDSPANRYNNPLQTFTEIMRSSFIAQCRSQGLEIDDEHRVNRPNLEKQQYIAKQMEQKISDLENEIVNLEDNLHTMVQDFIEKCKLNPAYEFENEGDFIEYARIELEKEYEKLDAKRSELQNLKKISQEATVKQGFGDTVKVKGATAEQVETALSYAKSLGKLQKENKSLRKDNKKLSEKVESLSDKVEHKNASEVLLNQLYEVIRLLGERSKNETIQRLCKAITDRIEMARFNSEMMPEPEELVQQLNEIAETEPELIEEWQEELYQ